MALAACGGVARLWAEMGHGHVRPRQPRFRRCRPRRQGRAPLQDREHLPRRRAHQVCEVQLRLHGGHGDQRATEDLGHVGDRRRHRHPPLPRPQGRHDHGRIRPAFRGGSAVAGPLQHPRRRRGAAGADRLRRRAPGRRRAAAGGGRVRRPPRLEDPPRGEPQSEPCRPGGRKVANPRSRNAQSNTTCWRR